MDDVGAGDDMVCGVKLISDELVEDEDDLGRADDENAGKFTCDPEGTARGLMFLTVSL